MTLPNPKEFYLCCTQDMLFVFSWAVWQGYCLLNYFDFDNMWIHKLIMQILSDVFRSYKVLGFAISAIKTVSVSRSNTHQLNTARGLSGERIEELAVFRLFTLVAAPQKQNQQCFFQIYFHVSYWLSLYSRRRRRLVWSNKRWFKTPRRRIFLLLL